MSQYQFETQNRLALSGKRFFVTYKIRADSLSHAQERAQDICVEQTVEFPAELVPAHIVAQGMMGKIESLDAASPNFYTAKISYAVEAASGELTQLLNVIFGNISIKPGIQIQDLKLEECLLKFIKGPRFGVVGLRERLNIYNRPMICSALKPMGLSAEDLSVLAGQFAKGGVDLIKDDHGLANQEFSKFEERVEKCQKAIAKNNPESVYLPNITAPLGQVRERALFAKAQGCKALLISPMLVGWDAVRALSEDNEIDLPIMAHPAFIGSLVTSPENGMTHRVLFGTMMRLMGADISVYPNFGGRFAFSKEECLDIVRGCSEELSGLAPIFPCPGGGMTFQNVPEMLKVYGNDVIYLMGGGLFRRGIDLVQNTRELKSLVVGN